jgi:hypothetical protein
MITQVLPGFFVSFIYLANCSGIFAVGSFHIWIYLMDKNTVIQIKIGYR